MSARRRQELYCHSCDRYVQFIVDLALDGNHVLNCPNCDHEHCRVVKNGVITDIRWDSRNGPTIPAYRIVGTNATAIWSTSTTSTLSTLVVWGTS